MTLELIFPFCLWHARLCAHSFRPDDCLFSISFNKSAYLATDNNLVCWNRDRRAGHCLTAFQRRTEAETAIEKCAKASNGQKNTCFAGDCFESFEMCLFSHFFAQKLVHAQSIDFHFIGAYIRNIHRECNLIW